MIDRRRVALYVSFRSQKRDSCRNDGHTMTVLKLGFCALSYDIAASSGEKQADNAV